MLLKDPWQVCTYIWGDLLSPSPEVRSVYVGSYLPEHADAFQRAALFIFAA
jgi:hypothetical protein